MEIDFVCGASRSRQNYFMVLERVPNRAGAALTRSTTGCRDASSSSILHTLINRIRAMLARPERESMDSFDFAEITFQRGDSPAVRTEDVSQGNGLCRIVRRRTNSLEAFQRRRMPGFLLFSCNR